MWILPKQLHTLAFALDTEALISDLNEQSQICAQSLFLRSKPSPLRTWSAKWKRDSWTQHLSGRILKPSRGESFVESWTSSLGATRVSHSAQQESVSELKIQDTSGPTLQMELLQCDQVSVFLKTSRDISRWGCPTLLKTWDAWVTERRGAYSLRLKSAHLTRGSGSSSWPTVTATEARQGFQDRSRGMKGSQESLTTIVVKESNWATPEALNSTGYQISNGQKALRLGSQVTSGLHALDNCSSVGSHQESWIQIPKLGRCATWMTPRTQMTRDGNQRWSQEEETLGGKVKWIPSHSNIKEQMAIIEEVPSAKLNPPWVETLMGLPVGWVMPSCTSPVTIEPTSCDYWATESFQQPLNSHSELFGMS